MSLFIKNDNMSNFSQKFIYVELFEIIYYRIIHILVCL